MIKIVLSILLIFFSIFSFSFSWYIWDDKTDDIYTQNQNDVLKSDDINDPLKNGTTSISEWLNWVVNADVSNSEQSQRSVLNYISKWINYFLSLLALLLIILIIFQWIKIITASGDDNKQKEAFTNVKNYIIALVLIWVSYLIISLIFHFVNYNTTI